MYCRDQASSSFFSWGDVDLSYPHLKFVPENTLAAAGVAKA